MKKKHFFANGSYFRKANYLLEESESQKSSNYYNLLIESANRTILNIFKFEEAISILSRDYFNHAVKRLNLDQMPLELELQSHQNLVATITPSHEHDHVTLTSSWSNIPTQRKTMGQDYNIFVNLPFRLQTHNSQHSADV